MEISMKKKKVALVLSGGAALGFAHIGVIKVFEKYGVPIDMIVGTSMGGLVGAAYAVGLSPEEMTEFACKFKNIHFVDVNFDTTGIFSGKGMMRNINKCIPDIKIEDLKLPFACVAFDLITEKEYVFKKGKLRDAVRSTISIPGFFTPHKVGKSVLVDGGVINNMPESVAKEMGADIIISCDVLHHCRLKKAPEGFVNTIMATMNAVTRISQANKDSLSDIVLTPNTFGIGQMAFGKKTALKAIEEGEKEAEEKIQEILKLIK